MIADHETNVVYVADTLELKFPSVFGGLKTILGRHGIPLRTIPGTQDIWCRDYMPIQVAEDRFVQFRYAPDYLTGKYRHLRADGQIGPSLPVIRKVDRSEIVLDGGNIVRWKDTAILTDKIYEENFRMGRRKLEAELRRVLEAKRLIIIPVEPGDVTGHSDGVVRFVGPASVILNDYSGVDVPYRRSIMRRLIGAGLAVVEIPYHPVSDCSGGMPSAVGNYMNFLSVRDLVIIPSYGLSGDERAFAIIASIFQGYAVRRLDCGDLASAGGVLNCATWTIHL